MLSIIVTVIISFLVTTIFGYFTHHALHQPWTGRFHRSHLVHHLLLYPKEDFTSNEYRNPGKDSSVIFFALMSVPLLLSVILLYLFGILSFKLTIITLCVMLFLGWLHDYLHDSFHINNHLASKIINKRLYKNWVDIHYNHHINMQSNLGIFWFGWDKLFKTFYR